MDFQYFSENSDLSGSYSTELSHHSTAGVSLVACALMCTSYAVCSSVFHNSLSERCILVKGFHFADDKLTKETFWHYFRPVANYTVTATTGRIPNAQTYEDIFLTIHGSKGHTNELVMMQNSEYNRFQKDSIDTFLFRSVDVGQIAEIQLHHENLYPNHGPDWFPVSVSITKDKEPSLLFQIGKWVTNETSSFRNIDTPR